MERELIGDKGKPRFFALVIDNVLAAIPAILIAVKIPGLSDTVRGLVLCLVYLSYFFISETLWDRSLGKLLTGLVVRGTDGSRCGWKRAAVRTLLRPLEVNPLLLGALPAGVSVLWTKRRQRLGDILAGTVVTQRSQATAISASEELSRPDV
jgi:uncharacterized RDD family membrane protein YckC